MSSSNSMALLERTSLNVYGADIFNCSRQQPDTAVATTKEPIKRSARKQASWTASAASSSLRIS